MNFAEKKHIATVQYTKLCALEFNDMNSFVSQAERSYIRFSDFVPFLIDSQAT